MRVSLLLQLGKSAYTGPARDRTAIRTPALGVRMAGYPSSRVAGQPATTVTTVNPPGAIMTLPEPASLRLPGTVRPLLSN